MEEGNIGQGRVNIGMGRVDIGQEEGNIGVQEVNIFKVCFGGEGVIVVNGVIIRVL